MSRKKKLEKFEMKNWNLNYASVETSQTFIEWDNRISNLKQYNCIIHTCHLL
jgi:hypothetical protein